MLTANHPFKRILDESRDTVARWPKWLKDYFEALQRRADDEDRIARQQHQPEKD